MSNMIFGVTNSDGIHTDVSRTLQGAKGYATKNGYKIVSSRDTNHYHVVIEAEKIDGEWIDLN